MNTKKAALEFAPREAAHEKPPNALASMNESNPRVNSTAWRPVAAGDDTLVRTLAEDLTRAFSVAAPEVDLVKLGAAIAAEGLRREARP